jgi:acetyltransferase-like isoleucine patch superfamily enzyme
MAGSASGMTRERGVRLRPTTLGQLEQAYGGVLRCPDARDATRDRPLGHFSPLETAEAGDLAPLLSLRFLGKAVLAVGRGAALLVEESLTNDPRVAALGGLVHSHAAWAMACVLEEWAEVPTSGGEPVPARLEMGRAVVLGEHVVLAPRVRVLLGDRVVVGPSSVIGGVGFGWASGPDGKTKRIPHLGGVILEDDVTVGPLCTIDAGVLSPTILRRGVHLDAHVHVAHNCEIGEGTFVAAQCGFAGSVKIGRNVQIGGQVGIADHVTVGDRARIAAKSGVISDIPEGATFAGYPALPRGRWLRGLARLYRKPRAS